MSAPLSMPTREIKFRVWDNRDNRWCVEQEYIGCEHGLTPVEWKIGRVNLHLGMGMSPEEIAAYRRKAFTVEQFTGLRDKNGKEVYDGDIIEAKWTERVGRMEAGEEVWEKRSRCERGQIIWTVYGIHLSYFTWLHDNPGEIGRPIEIQFYPLEHHEREVIGNVHEHSHLLNPTP